MLRAEDVDRRLHQTVLRVEEADGIACRRCRQAPAEDVLPPFTKKYVLAKGRSLSARV